jgi:Putative inner membrane exporter, YdcZ
MNAGWMIPFILLGGALQNCGAAMNGEFNKHATNPWLASTISFALNTFFFAGASVIHPHPLPTQKDFEELPWWALVGGLVGAVHAPTASIDLITSWFLPGGPPLHRDPIIATSFQDVVERPVNSGGRRIERDRCARERDCKLSREVRISWELRAAKNNFHELPLSEVWTRCSCLKGPRGREGARG